MSDSKSDPDVHVHNLCGDTWRTENRACLGSHPEHMCGLDRGHVGICECQRCDEVHQRDDGGCILTPHRARVENAVRQLSYRLDEAAVEAGKVRVSLRVRQLTARQLVSDLAKKLEHDAAEVEFSVAGMLRREQGRGETARASRQRTWTRGEVQALARELLEHALTGKLLHPDDIDRLLARLDSRLDYDEL
jgi:hypothetical protein